MDILNWIFGYENSLFDNRIVHHIAGAFLVCHVFFSLSGILLCLSIGIIKELLDHYIFLCGKNETKHIIDITSWVLGALLYNIFSFLKQSKTTN